MALKAILALIVFKAVLTLIAFKAVLTLIAFKDVLTLNVFKAILKYYALKSLSEVSLDHTDRTSSRHRECGFCCCCCLYMYSLSRVERSLGEVAKSIR